MSDRNEDLQERAYHVQYTNHDPEQVIALIEQDLPEFLELFISKSREYGDDNKFVLGSRGQFADMWRKFGKLKTGMWDGKESQLTSEGVDEILLDLIGHCFLTLQCRRAEAPTDFNAEDVSEPEEAPIHEYRRQIMRQWAATPRPVIEALTVAQMQDILSEARPPRDWDSIVSGKSDGRINYDLTEDEA